VVDVSITQVVEFEDASILLMASLYTPFLFGEVHGYRQSVEDLGERPHDGGSSAIYEKFGLPESRSERVGIPDPLLSKENVPHPAHNAVEISAKPITTSAAWTPTSAQRPGENGASNFVGTGSQRNQNQSPSVPPNQIPTVVKIQPSLGSTSSGKAVKQIPRSATPTSIDGTKSPKRTVGRWRLHASSAGIKIQPPTSPTPITGDVFSVRDHM
jgi:hypothetical protein